MNSHSILITLSRFTQNIKKEKDQKTTFKPYIEKFISWVEYGLRHDFYKVSIASLNLLYNIMDLIISTSGPSEYKATAENMVKMMIPIFKANDIDQELKQTVIITMGNLVKDMGHVLSENSLNAIFTIFLEKTLNENLRTLIFSWLTKSIRSNPELKVDTYLAKFMNSLLENINKNNVILQRQTLDFLTAIAQNQAKALSGVDETLAKSLIALLSENNLALFNVIFDLLSLLTNGFAFSKNASLLAGCVDSTIKSLELDDNESNFTSALFFVESAINLNCLNNKALGEYIANILKFVKLNISKAKIVAVFSKKIGNSSDLVNDLSKKVSLYYI